VEGLQVIIKMVDGIAQQMEWAQMEGWVLVIVGPARVFLPLYKVLDLSRATPCLQIKVALT
jgi:hypothetical protein